MFDDPALVLRCDVPFGWCLDGESSLFRLVFRPWERTDERVVMTVLPSAASPAAPDVEWADAARSALGLERAAAGDTLGPAVHGPVAQDEPFHRVVVRGPSLDVVADHVGGAAADDDSPAPILRRFVADARAPARLPVARVPSIEEAHERIAELEALGDQAPPGAGTAALRTLENAAGNRWIRSLALGDLARADFDALREVVRPRLAFGGRDALSLLRAHAVLLRARPGSPPSGPVLEKRAEIEERLAAIFAGAFGTVGWALRRLPRADADRWADADDDIFGSDAVVRLVLSHLVTEEVRDFFATDEDAPVDPAAVRQAVDAHVAGLGMLWPTYVADGQVADLLPELALLGRTVTAYADAALPMDLRVEVLEASAFLAATGRILQGHAGDNAHPVRAGRRLVAQGLIQQAGVLVRTADTSSLEAALACIEEAHAELDALGAEDVDRLNAVHNEALAAAQLGHLERARRAMERGAELAPHVHGGSQVEFFRWIGQLLEASAARPGVERSIPELQLALAARIGEPTVLVDVCRELDATLARDPFGLVAIELLALAARLVEDLDANLTKALLSASESLLDIQRLRLASSSELRGGADDARLARNVLAATVEELIRSGNLTEAAAAADRARARSLLLDLGLRARERIEFGDAIASFDPHQFTAVVDRMLREAWPSHVRPPPLWAQPFGAPNWLRLLVRELGPTLAGLVARFGPRPLEPEELLATVRDLGHPVLLLHPTGERIALLLATPAAEIHAAWSPVATSDLLARLESLRDELPVWISSRGKDWFGERRRDRAEEGAPATALRAAAGDVYRSLIDPVREHLNGASALTIVPYRELGAVPYALLEDAEGRPIAEPLALSVTPSVASLATIQRRQRRTVETRAYVLGNPATHGAFGLDLLPAAAREANAVRRRLAKSHPDATVVHRAGAKATVASYREEARNARLVHLSCHGYVGADAASSRLFLAPGPGDDGSLDVNEIAAVPLDGAVVFLAACRSGSGRATADGTVGLAREFLRAGASAVVAAYWNVSDAATARLVDHFYDSFVGGSATVAEALQRAMLATRDDIRARRIRLPKVDVERDHPVYWGPFFVLGDASVVDEL